MRGSTTELEVVAGHEALRQIPVRTFHGTDPGHLELLDQPVLERAVDAFAAATRLRRVGEDVLDAQLVEGAAYLGAASPVGGLAGFGSVGRPAGAIAVDHL